jgi:long-chain acyl-CoA synthetase
VVAEDGLIGVGWGSMVKILKTGSTTIAPADAEECAPGESGYVWLNTPALMKGYFQRDDLTAQVVRDGWFVTGDKGLVDERGYLYLCGREREEINKGGMKVYPGDIDAVVEQYENAIDVCTFACDDSFYGQNIAMAVVLKSGESETLRSLHQFMSLRLAAHKMPIRWFVVESIARTSRGKLNRASISEGCAALEPVDMLQILDTP